MARSVTHLALMYELYASYSVADHGSAVADHQRILHALAREDGERAELIIREHVLKARDSLLTRIGMSWAASPDSAASGA